jgi:hypothetical protein
MTNLFTLKTGDTSPSITYALLPATVDLTGATVRFSMRTRDDGTVIVNRAAAVIVTATPPVVRYDWQAGNTTLAGRFDAEFEVTYAGGAIETFPNRAFIDVLITSGIA